MIGQKRESSYLFPIVKPVGACGHLKRAAGNGKRSASVSAAPVYEGSHRGSTSTTTTTRSVPHSMAENQSNTLKTSAAEVWHLKQIHYGPEGARKPFKIITQNFNG